ncbi:MAG: TonB-dependent receptor [Salibacter sp.]|uniref:TonB-dependent receptor n=1 Tax=Salibacter sp. TaxID=2010995 RepID=UPI0028704F25|nr:TonB-dependent receptor [Salibacter sp.]MDR9398108.1 TonB-dependent receptor [Salibacter sp.]
MLNRLVFSFLSAVVLAAPLSAQVSLNVFDAESGAPLPNAHILYSGIYANKKKAVLTDVDGKAVISDSGLAKQQKVAVSVSYIGYGKVNDTLSYPGDYTIELYPESQFLNEFVVTGQYGKESTEKTVHNVRIVTREKMEKMAAVTLKDVLENEPNIRISKDPVLGSGLSMQGISGQNVNIMIDGVPIIGRQDGNIDLSQINLENIERIEIVEGPLSVNYGTNALAGTINLITKKEYQNNTEVNINSQIESIGTFNASAQVSQKIGKGRISLTGRRNYFDGWSKEDPVMPETGEIKADAGRVQNWNPREQYIGNIAVHYPIGNFNLRVNSQYFDEEIINKGMPRKPYNETAFDDFYYTTRFDNSIALNGEISDKLSLKWISALNIYKRQKNTYVTDLTTLDKELVATPGSQDTSTFNAVMSRGTFTYSQNQNLSFQGGFDARHEWATGQRFEDAGQMGDYAVFASSQINLFNSDLTLRPGLRYSYNTAYESPVTPSVNIRYSSGKFTYRGSYARGFRAPSLKELYFYFVDINHNIVGNDDLKAERSHNLAASASYKTLWDQKILQLKAKGFYNLIEERITLANVNSTEYSYVNVGEYKTHGLNFTGSLMLEHWKFNGTVSLIGQYNQLSEEYEADEYNYYPEFTGNTQYTIPKWDLSLALFYKYNGAMQGVALDENENVYQTEIESYSMLDFMITKKLWKNRITVGVGAQNIFDVDNIAATSSGGAHSTGESAMQVSTGRYYVGNIKIKISK